MVVTLQRRGYIQADLNDRYTLTLTMFQLANRQQPIKALVGSALPLLHELSERARQSCHLAIYQGGRVVIIAQVDSPERWSFGLKVGVRSEEHTSELQSLMRISYAVFCLKNKNNINKYINNTTHIR